MQYGTLDVQQLRQAFRGAKAFLSINKSYVDSLNVFPVPDGDTGTNMYLTLTAAVKETDQEKIEDIPRLLHALAGGALMGARGNSGVILSQLFRGFSQGAGSGDFDGTSLAEALSKAAEMAYRSVIKPVEGTMLTVAKAAAQGARQKAKDGGDCLAVLEASLTAAEEALKRTPQLLPVLAEAGVVDAGGQGYVYILQGMIAGLKGEVQLEQAESTTTPVGGSYAGPVQQKLEFRYCTELIIKGQGLQENLLKSQLTDLGDSLLVVGNEEVLKVHIHTNRPGLVLEKAAAQGVLYDIKIDNMEEQHREFLPQEQPEPPKPIKEMAAVAVTVGEGLSEILTSLGVDVVVKGGQTMNPSTEDLVAGIKEAGARQVILLPNNKNIILAAEQAQHLAAEENIQVAVVPAKNFTQCLAALLAYNPDESLEENRQRMLEALDTVKAGEITYAVRDSQYNGFQIASGEILGLAEGEIAAKGDNLEEVALKLLKELGAEDYELLSVFYGQDVEEDQAQVLKQKILEAYSHLEVEVHRGGQPLYYYIFGLE